MTAHTDEGSGIATMQAAAAAQAMDWFVRHRTGELSAAEKQGFMEWLRASPLNVAEYMAAVRMAQDLPAAAAYLRMHKPHLAVSVPDAEKADVISLEATRGYRGKERLATQPRSGAGKLRWAALAAGLAVALVGSALWMLGTPEFVIVRPQVVETARDEQRNLVLDDGSVAHLNHHTRVTVRYSKQQRLIEFQGGQALFQVARDPLRPFRVRAGNDEVVAVGTQFELRQRDGEAVAVTVVEGRVDVLHAGTHPNTIDTIRLQAGDQVQLGSTPKVKTVDVGMVATWVQRELSFTERPLSDVAREFNRYSSVPVVIDDPALRELQVSGIFRAYDTDSFVGFLQQFPGVEVERGPQAIRVHRRPGKN